MGEIYELQNALRFLDEALHVMKHRETKSAMLLDWEGVCREWRRCERLAGQLSDCMKTEKI